MYNSYVYYAIQHGVTAQLAACVTGKTTPAEGFEEASWKYYPQSHLQERHSGSGQISRVRLGDATSHQQFKCSGSDLAVVCDHLSDG